MQTAFAVTFAVTRFFMYGIGLAYQLNLLPYMPDYVPAWAALSTISVVVVGFFLNVVWLVKIVRIASRPNRSSRAQPAAPTPTPEPLFKTEQEQERHRRLQQQFKVE